MRRVGIVALARCLAIALWRYLHDGEIPPGASSPRLTPEHRAAYQHSHERRSTRPL
jgi:hypothetical protein